MIFAEAFASELTKVAKRRKKKATSYPAALTAAGRGALVGAGLGSLGSLLADKVPSYWSLPDTVSYRLGRATRHGMMGAPVGALGGLAVHHILRPPSKRNKK